MPLVGRNPHPGRTLLQPGDEQLLQAPCPPGLYFHLSPTADTTSKCRLLLQAMAGLPGCHGHLYRTTATAGSRRVDARQEEYQSQMPFWLRWGTELTLGCVLTLNVVDAMGPAQGHRARVAMPRPSPARPVCDYCGYNLIAASPDGVCPECGASVSASLGPRSPPRRGLGKGEQPSDGRRPGAGVASTRCSGRRPSATESGQVHSPAITWGSCCDICRWFF